MKEVFENSVATGELATATAMRAQKRQHSVYTIESSSSDADPDTEVVSPATFALTSVDPPSPLVTRSQMESPLSVEPFSPLQNQYQPRKKRIRTSPTQVSVQAIAGSIESLATSIRETSQKLENSSTAAFTTSSPGVLLAANTGVDRLKHPIPSTPLEHAVLVLNGMLETAAITIKEYREALDILKENPIEVSIFAFGVPVMQKDWIERNVRLIGI